MQSRLRHSGSLSFRSGGSGSSWTPQSLGSKVAWFRELDEVGGHQPNQIRGMSDYLTIVSGTGLNKVYTLPNTTTYKNADTNYAWWKTDGSLSTTDGNRLIAYDFARTIVKYDNTTPYAIREIIILTAGASLTTAEMNHLRDYMQLSIWWDNTLSFHGDSKSNRTTGQSVWTAEEISVSPVFLSAQIADAHKDRVLITFDHALVETPVPDVSAFPLAGKTVNNVAISGAVVTLTVTASYDWGDIPVAGYTKPGSNTLKDLSTGGEVATFSAQAITNNIAYPTILNDGNTRGFYDAQDLTTITKNGSNVVSKWTSKINGADVLQNLGTPHWRSTGVYSNWANNDFMKATGGFGRTQPDFLWILFKQLGYNTNYALIDGIYTDYASVKQGASSGYLGFYANGSGVVNSVTAPLNEWHILRVLFNGVSSKMILDNGSPVTGNPGTGIANDGLSLFARGNGSYGASVEFNTIIIRAGTDAANETAIYNFLAARKATL